MEHDSDEMHKVIADLYTNSASILNSQGIAHLIDDNVIVLNLDGSEIYDLRMNIYDAVSAMQMQGFILHNEYVVSNPEAKVGIRNRRAFYLQTNGNFETLI